MSQTVSKSSNNINLQSEEWRKEKNLSFWTNNANIDVGFDTGTLNPWKFI